MDYRECAKKGGRLVNDVCVITQNFYLKALAFAVVWFVLSYVLNFLVASIPIVNLVAPVIAAIIALVALEKALPEFAYAGEDAVKYTVVAAAASALLSTLLFVFVLNFLNSLATFAALAPIASTALGVMTLVFFVAVFIIAAIEIYIALWLAKQFNLIKK